MEKNIGEKRFYCTMGAYWKIDIHLVPINVRCLLKKEEVEDIEANCYSFIKLMFIEYS